MVKQFSVLLSLVLILNSVQAHAHFIWITTQPATQKNAVKNNVHVSFGESAKPDDPEVLEYIKTVKLSYRDSTGKTKDVPLKKEGATFAAAANLVAAQGNEFFLTHTFGIRGKGDAKYLLVYHAKTYTSSDPKLWTSFETSLQAKRTAALELSARLIEETLVFRATSEGKIVPNAKINIIFADGTTKKGTTDEKGFFSVPAVANGLYAARVKNIEKTAGKYGDEDYPEIRRYATLTVNLGDKKAAPLTTTRKFPAIPESVTSFGAAISGNSLYYYGGHHGGAHKYHKEAQGNQVWALNLKQPTKWTSIAKGPSLQGLAMVAHDGKLYRIGGFTAKNKEGQKHNLWSQANVASFDPKTKSWSELPPLPEPRSSFDAAVLGDTIYVIGGWQMSGKGKSVWHKTAYSLDLKVDKPAWTALPEAPFERRALSVAVHKGKLYAIGGMQRVGGPSTQVDIFDPATKKWSKSPSLLGEGMEGFGSSSFSTGGRLYVSTLPGNLQRLSTDGKSWELVKELDNARFFHRMLPFSDHELLFIGGASMSEGKFDEVEVIDTSSLQPIKSKPKKKIKA